MSLTPSEQAVEDRLDGYNGGEWDPDTNPLGFDGGGNQRGVFVAMLKDVAAYGRIVVRSTTETLAYVSGKVAEFQAAVDAIKAGPVSSVNGRSGAVSGLAELSGPVFTNDPKAPTAAIGDSDTTIATTAFVQRELQRRAFESNLHYGS